MLGSNQFFTTITIIIFTFTISVSAEEQEKSYKERATEITYSIEPNVTEKYTWPEVYKKYEELYILITVEFSGTENSYNDLYTQV